MTRRATFSKALSSGGATVAVVGEWGGNTGDGKFAAALVGGFKLVRRVPLPQWGDTAHELTIWVARAGAGGVGVGGGGGGGGTDLSLAACSHCGKGCRGGGGGGEDDAKVGPDGICFFFCPNSLCLIPQIQPNMLGSFRENA